MAEQSKIEWTEATWNPIVGCSIHSPGCKGCYAMRVAWRLQHNPNPKIAAKFAGTARLVKGEPVFTGRVNLDEAALLAPLRRKKPTVYFVNSLSDLFHVNVPDETVDRIFAVMALCPQHSFQVLTKRADRMRAYVTVQAEGGRHVTAWVDRWQNEGLIKPVVRDWIGQPGNPRPLRNVWLGASVEDQKRADERIPELLATPAAVRFLSCEPLIGEVDLLKWLDPTGACCGSDIRCRDCPSDAEWRYDLADENGFRDPLDWVICGGESGPKARPMHPDWARSLRDQCASAGVPFFFKQWGNHATIYDRDAEDPDWKRCAEIARTNPKGQWLNLAAGQGFHGERVVFVSNVGKKAAGRLLDGVTHDGMPEARHG